MKYDMNKGVSVNCPTGIYTQHWEFQDALRVLNKVLSDKRFHLDRENRQCLRDSVSLLEILRDEQSPVRPAPDAQGKEPK